MKMLLILIAVGTALASPSSASAAAAPCLAGAPEAAGDAAALAGVRLQIEASCPCSAFTGAMRQTHRDYIFCARDVLREAMGANTLRAACRRTAMYAASRSNCGFAPSQNRRPCVHTSMTGNVSCHVRPEKFCRGPRNTWCSTYTSCLDAADTNGDHRVSRDDGGECNPPVQCFNPPADNGSSCDDGDPCTQDDDCQSGTCAGTPYSCTPGVCHQAGSCNGDGTCTFTNQPDGRACDTGVDARPPLTCNTGSCGGCVPAGVCSVTSRGCAFDGQCPSGETCNLGSTPSPRHVDNGDGTITDRQTCLVWEKKGEYDSAPVQCPGGATCDNPHDADNTYSWSSAGTAQDGSAFTLFLNELNGSSFAGHANWRLPLELGLEPTFVSAPKELESLLDGSAAGCGSGAPCTAAAFSSNCTPSCSGSDPTCSCTAPSDYWTVTADSANAGSAWLVGFGDNPVASAPTTGSSSVRAVRGGMTYQNCDEQAALLAAKKTAAYEVCVNVDCEDPEVDNFRCILGCISAYRTMDSIFATEVAQPCVADRGVQCDALYADVAAICTTRMTAECPTNCNPLYPICQERCLAMIDDCTSAVQETYAYCTQTNR